MSTSNESSAGEAAAATAALTVVTAVAVPMDMSTAMALARFKPDASNSFAITQSDYMDMGGQVHSLATCMVDGLVDGETKTVSDRYSTGGATVNTTIKVEACNKRPSPVSDVLKKLGSLDAKYIMRGPGAGSAPVALDLSGMNTVKHEKGSEYALLCKVPLLMKSLQGNGVEKFELPALKSTESVPIDRFGVYHSANSLKVTAQDKFLTMSVHRPSLYGMDGDEIKLLLTPGSAAATVCTLGPAIEVQQNAYATTFSALSNGTLITKYIESSFAEYGGRAVPDTMVPTAYYNVERTRILSNAYIKENPAMDESTRNLYLSLETMPDYIIFEQCTHQYRSQADKKKLFKYAMDNKATPMFDEDLDKTKLYSFDVLCLDPNGHKFNQQNHAAEFLPYAELDSFDMETVGMQNPYCKHFHRFGLKVRYLVTSTDLFDFFSKKASPSLISFASFIKTRAFPAPDQRGCKAFQLGSIFDEGLKISGVRWDLRTSWLANPYTAPDLILSLQEDCMITTYAVSGFTPRVRQILHQLREQKRLKDDPSAAIEIEDNPQHLPMKDSLKMNEPFDIDQGVRMSLCMEKTSKRNVWKTLEWSEIGLGFFEPIHFTRDTPENMAMVVYFFVNLFVRCAGMGPTSKNGPSLIDADFAKRWTVGNSSVTLGDRERVGVLWRSSVVLATTICMLLSEVFDTKPLFDKLPVVLPFNGMQVYDGESPRKSLAKYILRLVHGNEVDKFAFSNTPLNEISYQMIKMYLATVHRMVKNPALTFADACNEFAELGEEGMEASIEEIMRELNQLAVDRINGGDAANEFGNTQKYAEQSDNDLRFEHVESFLQVDKDEMFVFKGASFPFVKRTPGRNKNGRKRKNKERKEEIESEEEDEDAAPRRKSGRIEEMQKNGNTPKYAVDGGEEDGDEEDGDEGDGQDGADPAADPDADAADPASAEPASAASAESTPPADAGV